MVGMQTGTITTEKNIKVLQKAKNNTTTWSSNSTPRYIYIPGKKWKHLIQKDTQP